MWEVWLWAALCSGIVLSAPHLGESTELAWLLVQESPQQSPLLLRRITPKSVFLAPTFTSCSEGYRQDAMGRCVKVVKLNQQAQWEFLLQKLNSMYAAPEPSKKENSGPIRLNIPIEEEPISSTTLATTTEAPTTALTTVVETTGTPFLIVVANATETLILTETTTEATTHMESTEDTPTVPKSTTELVPSTLITEGTTRCYDCTEETVSFPSRITVRFPELSKRQSGQAHLQLDSTTLPPSTVPLRVFQTISMPSRDTIRFPDTRKRPSSYVRFPGEAYPYWWPHTWDRTPVHVYI